MSSSMTTWPDGGDLADWISSPKSAALRAKFDGLVAAATGEIRGLCDPSLLPDNAGICPAEVRTAILVEAAWLSTLPDNANGMVSFGDFATVTRNPKVDRLLIRYRMSPSP